MKKKKILLAAACAALPVLADDGGLQRCRAIADSASRHSTFAMVVPWRAMRVLPPTWSRLVMLSSMIRAPKA